MRYNNLKICKFCHKDIVNMRRHINADRCNKKRLSEKQRLVQKYGKEDLRKFKK